MVGSTLMLVVCMATNQAVCKSVNVQTEMDISLPHQCMMVGQLEASKYLEGHPNWTLKKWVCGRPQNSI